MVKSLEDLKKELDEFCSQNLPSSAIPKIKNGKIIHDTTWKTNFFEPYEVAIINTPLFQRLRNINQMGFVDYVYPSAKHSRFEHSLGVTILAGKMVDAVRRDPNVKNLISDNDKISIRMSALLHDVGHCLFSHTSELVYGYSLVKCIKEEFKGKDVDPAPHEFLSYLIITSNAFSLYFNKLKQVYKLNLDVHEIAARIVGLVEKEEERFKTYFINGPFDADKLDYFHRDSQFSGIPIQLDIERLFYEIAISDVSVMDDSVTNTVYDLTIGVSGIGCIEQIIFNKMLLYSSIYHHHKVQAIDCMFKGIFEYILENKIPITINGQKKPINSPVDFLYLVDYDLYSIVNDVEDAKLKKLICNIKERKLLKRSLVINHGSIKKKEEQFINEQDISDLESILQNRADDKFRKTLEEKIHALGEKSLESNKGGLKGLISILSTKANREDKNKYLRILAQKILKDANVDCMLSEVWIDIPKIPSFKETSTLNVRTSKDRDNKDFKHIDDFYPYNPYKDLYITNKMNGHIFAPEHCLKEIAQSAKKIFKQELNIEFNDKADIHVN
jgi:HD superfamily phosphohydrolase